MNVTHKLFSTLFLNIVIFIIVFIISVVLSRSLGPENYGVYQFLILIASTLTLFTGFGLVEMLQLKLAQKLIRLKDYIASTLSATMPIYLITLCVLFYFFYVNDSLGNQVLLNAGLMLCLLFQLNFIFHNAIFALDKIVTFQMVEIIRHGANLMLILFAIYFNFFNLPNVFWIMVFTNIFSVVYILFYCFRHRVAEKINFAYSKELFKNSLRTYLNNILTFITYRFDVYILKLFVGFYEIGIYTLAVALVEKLWIFPTSIRSVLYLELNNKRKDEAFVAQILRLLTLFVIVVGSVVAVLSFYIIPFVFSERFEASVVPFLILLPGILMFCFSKILAAYFISCDMIKINTYSSIIIACINLILNLILIPKYLIFGAALSKTIAFTIGSIYHLKVFNKVTKTNYTDMLIIKKNDFSVLKLLKKVSNK